MHLLDIPRRSRQRIAHVPDTVQERVPTQAWFWAACGSIAGSLLLQVMRKHHASLFVGQWAPTFLALGLLHKLSKRR